jgi:hypothetical protein
VTIPSSLALGPCVVPETNETNNCSAASSRVQVGPDLVEAGVTSQTVIASVGATFTVSYTASNQGGGSAAASLTQYYLSPLISKSAIGARWLAGNRSVPALAPAATSSGSATVSTDKYGCGHVLSARLRR